MLRPAAEQLTLDLDPAPRDAGEMLGRLTALGMRGVSVLRLTRNRTVMVSVRQGVVRLHRGFLGAPAEVLRAVAAFVSGPSRAERLAARRQLLAYPIPRAAGDTSSRARRREPRHPADAPAEQRLIAAHGAFNAERFGGTLEPIPIRISRRLRRRLGYYRLAAVGETPEIVISRRHLRRHGWAEVLATLLHEMVHQWQDETGAPVDHGRAFRAKARAVGVMPAARRPVA